MNEDEDEEEGRGEMNARDECGGRGGMAE